MEMERLNAELQLLVNAVQVRDAISAASAIEVNKKSKKKKHFSLKKLFCCCLSKQE